MKKKTKEMISEYEIEKEVSHAIQDLDKKLLEMVYQGI